MTYPRAIVSEFNDLDDEPDNGSFFVGLQLGQNDGDYPGNFDFCFNKGIGDLLEFNYHVLAMRNGAYYRHGGNGLDYFFKNKSAAEKTAKEINDIIFKIKKDDNKISKVVRNYRKLMEQDSQKSQKQGYSSDSVQILESIPEYIESFLA